VTSRRGWTDCVRRLRWIGIPALLGLLLAQMAFSSVHKSATFDEPYHLGAGYAYLRTGDPRLSWEHPPLVDTLAALPLLLRHDVVLPLDHPTWDQADIVNFSDHFLWEANFARAPELVIAGRWPVMCLTVFLGLALFLALLYFSGEPAAWLGLALFALDPNIAGNGRIITTDLGLTCFFFIAVWRLGAYLNRPTSTNLILTGLAAGLALCAKFSGILVAPVFLLVALLYRPPDGRQLSLARRAAALAGMGALALLVLWAAYGFEFGPVGETGLPVPSPTYWRGMIAVYQRVQASTPTYFLGQSYDAGPWYYFPAIFTLKTPLPTLILLGLGLARILSPTPSALERRHSWDRRHPAGLLPPPLQRRHSDGAPSERDARRNPDCTRRPIGARSPRPDRDVTSGSQQAVLWLVPPAVVFAATMASPLKMSYRYILPALPFVIAFGSSMAVSLVPPRARLRRVWQAMLPMAVAWAALTAARIYPHHLSYVNVLGGSPENACFVFSDADWGQDLIGLREYMAAEGLDSVHLSYFGSADPSAYGLSFRPLPGFRRALTGPDFFGYNPYTPAAGTYAISTTSLQLGLLYQKHDLYAIFRDREPEARIGYSIHIYEVAYPPEGVEQPTLERRHSDGAQSTLERRHSDGAQSAMSPTRAVVVGPAVADLPPETLGVQPGRPLIAKWAAPGALVLAAGGPARYLGEVAMPASSAVGTLLREENPLADARPLIEALPGDPLPLTPGQVPVPLPAPFDGGPALAGYELSGTAVAPGDTVDLVTYWQVGETVRPSLAAFVHLLDAGGNVVSQWDGWPVASGGLEPGDVVVLHHPLVVSDGTSPGSCTLQVGLYDAPDGPRLSVAGEDRLLLPCVEVIGAGE